VKVPAQEGHSRRREKAEHDLKPARAARRRSPHPSKATSKAPEEGSPQPAHRTVAASALGRQEAHGQRALRFRQKAAKTKGAKARSTAAKKAARTRAKRPAPEPDARGEGREGQRYWVGLAASSRPSPVQRRCRQRLDLAQAESADDGRAWSNLDDGPRGRQPTPWTRL
jgi:hypothetical protein